MIGKIHERWIFDRRVRVLATALAPLFPRDGAVLDVGCGDGQISARIGAQRPDITISGIDVLLRPVTHIPVTRFDGETIPRADKSVDTVLFVDVLHHTPDPARLLREATRVARHSIVIKDHLEQGIFARSTLRLMDYVGNARHGVNLPYNYLQPREWEAIFAELHCSVRQQIVTIPLYPWLLQQFFGRKLHVIFELSVAE